MAEIPEEILRRSAEAKAKATGRPVEEILAELKGEAAAPQASASSASEAAATPAAPPPDSLKGKAQATAAAVPEHLLRRSAEARAKALGVPVEEIIAEMTGGAVGAASAPTEPAPAPASAAAAPASTGEIDWKAAGAKAGMPGKLLRRSVEAKATAAGTTLEAILTEMVGDIPRVSEEPAAAAPAPDTTEAPAAAAPAAAPAAPAAPAASGPVDWEAAAAAAGMSPKLLQRSAEAKAKALGRPIAEIVAEMTGIAAAPAPDTTEAPAAAAPAAAPAAPAAPAASGPVDWEAAAAAAGMSPKLLQRSAEAKAKALGRPLAEIVAEMTGIAAAPAPDTTEAPAAAAPAAPAAPAASGPVDWEAAAAAAGMSPKLLQRSAEAKAKALGRPIAEIVAEMTGIAAAGAAPAAAPTPAPAAVAAAAPARSNLPPVPDGVNTQRLLTVVQAQAIQGARKEPVDKVNVWPHLLAIEFVALLVVLALLVVFSVFQDAPLLELANPNAQPNPSKAPWYFLGLQELLSYFDPQVAGVLIPGLGLAGLAIIPYIDRNPSTKPANRKFAIMVFTFFVVASAILTIIGSFYRGKGFNFTFPWRDGIFFDL